MYDFLILWRVCSLSRCPQMNWRSEARNLDACPKKNIRGSRRAPRAVGARPVRIWTLDIEIYVGVQLNQPQPPMSVSAVRTVRYRKESSGMNDANNGNGPGNGNGNGNGNEGHNDHTTEIIVNGRTRLVSGKELTFVQVVNLAFDDAVFNDVTVYTVTYKRGADQKPEGTMVAGETVKIKKGMVFNVQRTDKS